MTRTQFLIAWIVICLLCFAVARFAKAQPAPPFQPPPGSSGQILEIGPNGLGVGQYSRGGQNYWIWNSRGYRSQHTDPAGNITVYQGRMPDPPAEDIIRRGTKAFEDYDLDLDGEE